MVPRRVVITGVGVACALGCGVDSFWRNLLAGVCGISRLPGLPGDCPLPVTLAGHVPDALLGPALAGWGIDEADRAGQFSQLTVGQALADAGWPVDGQRDLEHDLVVGTGHGLVSFTNEVSRVFHEGGYRKVRPTSVVRGMVNRLANAASIRYRLTGTSYTVSCACASGAIALAEAFHRVRFGLAPAAIAACADSALDVCSFSAWNRLGVLSSIPDPGRASRPFDQGRQGLVMGEGGAAFVLEPLEEAERRGAGIWAEVVACASTNDARHIVQPQSEGQVRALRRALGAAGLRPEDIDYVNAHGTATELADVVEAATLRAVFGARADSLPVGNTKAQLGHLMGATAGVELVATLLALRHALIPACRNLENPDPRCPLHFVTGAARPGPLRHVLKNSFAFGGTNCAVVLRRL